ncbi:MAG: ROK family protein [Saprospiraceae bacterium]|nr:ROK family protein [Saprospiraceae bacterium]
MEKQYAVGIDIGGSHISTALVEMKSNQLLDVTQAERKVDNQAEAAQIMATWCDAIQHSLSFVAPSQIAGLGLAMPGPFDYEQGIGDFENVEKYQHLKNFNVTTALHERLQQPFTIRYVNDAIAFGLGEYGYLEKEGFQRMTAITLGTGLGSSFINKGVPVLDDLSVPKKGWFGGLPYKDNIADDYFTTRWFLKQFYEVTGQTATGVKEISDLAASSSLVRNIFEVFGERLGQLIGKWLVTFNTEILILGGNISNAYAWFGSALEHSLRVQNIQVTIRLSVLKETASLLGSAMLLEETYWQPIALLLKKCSHRRVMNEDINRN